VTDSTTNRGSIGAAIGWMFLLTTVLSTMPLIGVIAGFGAFAFVAAHVGPLLLGAIIGGATAS
jgi:hypothetical protein